MNDEFKEFLAEAGFKKKDKKVEEAETFKRPSPEEELVALYEFWGVERK